MKDLNVTATNLTRDESDHWKIPFLNWKIWKSIKNNHSVFVYFLSQKSNLMLQKVAQVDVLAL